MTFRWVNPPPVKRINPEWEMCEYAEVYFAPKENLHMFHDVEIINDSDASAVQFSCFPHNRSHTPDYHSDGTFKNLIPKYL